MFGLAGPFWVILARSWTILEAILCHSRILSGLCWAIRGLSELGWAMLGHSGPFWAVLENGSKSEEMRGNVWKFDDILGPWKGLACELLAVKKTSHI